MAKKSKPPRRRWVGVALPVFLALGLVAAGYAGLLTRIVQVERTEVYLADLPEAMDGTTILFCSDVDMCGLTGSGCASKLFRDLQPLKPDMLILGGDYANPSLFNRLNGTDDSGRMAKRRKKMFQSLADFSAPLGKYAVAGENDAETSLAGEMAAGGIRLLADDLVSVSNGTSSIYLAGTKDHSDSTRMDYGSLTGKGDREQCVIAVCHNPATASTLLTIESEDSGQWCDLVLTGHTHGGQIVIGGKRMIAAGREETRYPTGWSKQMGTPLLVSPGVGCEAFNLRLGTRAKVHLITLRRGEK